LAKKLIVVACLGISGSSMSAFAQSNQHALPYVQTQNILEQTRHPAATLIVKVTNGPEPLDRAFLKCVVFDDKTFRLASEMESLSNWVRMRPSISKSPFPTPLARG
jgi:hypothetical protein